MCGIFGYLNKLLIPNIENIYTSMILNHRGPDDTGWLLYDGSNVSIGKSKIPNVTAKLFLLHKRLSIIDLSRQGWQPMMCHNNRYYLIFNGEIYNYFELKKYLTEQGVHFKSRSDSEVLLHAYIHWGRDCLSKFVGMFAFAIFDQQLNRIFMARDSFGIKPFYYFHNDEKFIFSSEIKAILPFLINKKINPSSLFHYLRSGATDFNSDTFVTGIQQLPPGHYFEIDVNSGQKTVPVAYWQPSIKTNNDISFLEASEKLRDLFLISIDLHLRSDVAVAATLSGGIDSSAIVASIRHLYPTVDIHTFSYIADETYLSEEKWIDIVNEDVNAFSHKVSANQDLFLKDLEQLIAIQDEPFGSTSIYAQHRVFQAAAKANIKVMLDGQGADEMLGGYTFYLAARFISLIKQCRFKEAWQLLKSSRQNGNHILFRSLSYLLPFSWQMPLRKFSGQAFVPSWLNESWFLERGVELTPLKTKYGKHVLQDELLHTFSVTSLPMLLRYEDRNSMAYSIESRVPFLTTQLVEFIFSLPENYIISAQGLSKAIFRKAMHGIVPQSILARRDKIGFATPEKNWLFKMRPWMEETLCSEYVKNLPIFNHKTLLSNWQYMLRGKEIFDCRYWRWINFIKWAQLHQVDFSDG